MACATSVEEESRRRTVAPLAGPRSRLILETVGGGKYENATASSVNCASFKVTSTGTVVVRIW